MTKNTQKSQSQKARQNRGSKHLIQQGKKDTLLK